MNKFQTQTHSSKLVSPSFKKKGNKFFLLTYSKVASITGKSMSEALIFASTKPQYDNRLFIELPAQYMKIPSSEHGENMGRTSCAHKLF